MKRRKSDLYFVLAVVVTFMLCIGIVKIFAQTKKSYELTEIQKLRLEVKQKDAQLAQQTAAIAQSRFQSAVTDFNDQVKAIEKENGWPETLQVDPNTLAFREPPELPKAPEVPASGK